MDGYNPSDRPELESPLPTIALTGSGKKGTKTVNISTLAAITASSTGAVTVCKTSSAATSSLTGSSDFAEAVGVKMAKDQERMAEVALETGLGIFSVASCVPNFVDQYDGIFFAPHAMSFGLAGLLTPYRTDALLYGLAHPDTQLSHDVLKSREVPGPVVVANTSDGIRYVDEALPLGKTKLSLNGATYNHEFASMIPEVSPSSFAEVTGGSVRDNVAKGLNALRSGETSELSRTIALNAGLILYAAGVRTIEDGYREALAQIKEGQALMQLARFVKATGGSPNSFQNLMS